jgi:hypothetical protein
LAPSSPESGCSTTGCTSPEPTHGDAASSDNGTQGSLFTTTSEPSTGIILLPTPRAVDGQRPRMQESREGWGATLGQVVSNMESRASTSSPAGSHARAQAPPATGTGSSTPKPFCGERWLEPLASFDPGTSSWRTWRTSLLSMTEPSGERFSGRWPRSGSMSSGIAFLRRPSAPLTAVTGSSLLLGTPTSHERTHTLRQVDHGRQLANDLALLPTPRTSDQNGAGRHGVGGPDLRTVVDEMRLLLTPHGFPKEGQARKPGPTGNELGHALGSLSSGASTSPRSEGGRLSTGLRLNPSFVEWMLGAPPGWSDPACPLSATEFKCGSAGSSGST